MILCQTKGPASVNHQTAGSVDLPPTDYAEAGVVVADQKRSL
jgi:hypothetical protein